MWFKMKWITIFKKNKVQAVKSTITSTSTPKLLIVTQVSAISYFPAFEDISILTKLWNLFKY